MKHQSKSGSAAKRQPVRRFGMPNPGDIAKKAAIGRLGDAQRAWCIARRSGDVELERTVALELHLASDQLDIIMGYMPAGMTAPPMITVEEARERLAAADPQAVLVAVRIAFGDVVADRVGPETFSHTPLDTMRIILELLELGEGFNPVMSRVARGFNSVVKTADWIEEKALKGELR